MAHISVTECISHIKECNRSELISEASIEMPTSEAVAVLMRLTASSCCSSPRDSCRDEKELRMGRMELSWQLESAENQVGQRGPRGVLRGRERERGRPRIGARGMFYV